LTALLAAWYDIRDLSNAVERLLEWVGDWGPNWLVYVLSALIGGAAIFMFVVLAALVNGWLERRAIGRIQVRLGPNRVGPFGLFQPIADTLKLMLKEPLFPRRWDRVLFIIAPIAVYVPAVLVYAVFPFGEGMTFVDLNVGVIYILAVSSLTVIAVFMAGWASNNKFSLLSAMRVIAMMVSYEVPMVLSLLGVVLFAGTMSLGGIVSWQQDHRIWLFLLQPLAALIYLICGTAELNRSPLDIGEAESEIVAGYHTEYSGMRFGLFYAVDLINAVAVSAIIATLFFGGWWLLGLDRWIPGWMIFVGKTYVVYMLLVWMRGTLPRLRIDQLLAFAWKFLLPLALVNVLLAALEILIWVEYEVSAGVVLPVFTVVNLSLAVALVVGWTRLMAFRFERLPKRAVLVRDVGVAAS
jgi:NADH-quinone oxidoreductase subunit H